MRLLARALAAATLLSAIGVAGLSASASAATKCPTRSTKAAFSQWGDQNQYFVANNGRFEAGAKDWTLLGGARVVTDQAPWKINGANDSKALQLPAAATAESVSICVAANEESLRFFYKSPGTGSLKVRMDVDDDTGSASSVFGFGTSQQGWGVSPIIKLPSLRDADGDQWIVLTFEATGGTWLVDDVMVDPWITR